MDCISSTIETLKVDFPDLVFIPSDHRTKVTHCWCGCPPSADADALPVDDWHLYVRDDISRIQKRNFLTKPFADYNDAERRALKTRILEYITYYAPNRHFPEKRVIKDNHYEIEELINSILMFSSLISVKDFLNFMEWTPEKNPREFYICLEKALDNGVYPNGRNWRNQALLLDQIKVFFDDFHADPNHEFIHRHTADPSDDKPNQDPLGEIFYSRYPLHLAMARNMPKEVADYLIGIGADPYLTNEHCCNAFYSCLSTNNPDVYDPFMDIIRKETPDSPKKLLTKNPFIWACESHSPSRICVLEKLLTLGFDINGADDFPAIINMFSGSAGSDYTNYYKYQILVWMIEKGGADINIRGKDGRTLMHLFCLEPPGHFIHPHGLDYIINKTNFDWASRDDAGLNPCEYLIDYHLECYHSNDNLYHGAKLPNLLCQIILRTGFANITDAGLPAGMKPGDRIKLAKVLLFLKYQSLLRSEEKEHVMELQSRICTALMPVYYPIETEKQLQFPDISNTSILYHLETDIAKIFTSASDTADDIAAVLKYRQLIRKIIMTDSIRGPGEEAPKPRGFQPFPDVGDSDGDSNGDSDGHD